VRPLLEVDRLSKSYGDLPVLRDVAFHVDEGESLAILGPSGCGKSTLLQNAELPLQIRGVDRKRRREEVASRLPSFGLAGFEDAYPHELSGGMRQRAGLLRAVVSGAAVLVLDEPFGALDTLTRHRLQDWLSGLMSELHRTMLFVTHDLEEAVVLADRVLVLSGRPAGVIGETGISLSREERSDRLSPLFYREKDGLLSMIRKGDER